MFVSMQSKVKVAYQAALILLSGCLHISLSNLVVQIFFCRCSQRQNEKQINFLHLWAWNDQKVIVFVEIPNMQMPWYPAMFTAEQNDDVVFLI